MEVSEKLDTALCRDISMATDRVGDMERFLANNGFNLVAGIAGRPNRGPAFALVLDISEDLAINFQGKVGWVYAWVEKIGAESHVVYVGKTSKTLEARCKQHRAGFGDVTSPGSRHSERIQRGIREGKTYWVHARVSATAEHFGETISSCDAEEVALLKKFGPA